MLLACGTLIMTEDEQFLWASIVDGLDELQAASGDDPWLFHGTSAEAAQTILADGFDPDTSWVSTRPATGGTGYVTPCVFWTDRVRGAANHAQGKTGFPVILMARLSSVVASGLAVPDRNSWICDHDEDPALEPKDWQDSLAKFSAIAVIGCRKVDGLRAVKMASFDRKPDATGYFERIAREMTGRAADVPVEDPVASPTP